MNSVNLLGRLTKDVETRYTQAAEPVAVSRYTLAVNRKFKKDETDFINIVVFGKGAEFAEKYFRKGQMVGVTGRLQVRSWENKEGVRQWSTEVVAEEQHFAESKKQTSNNKFDESEYTVIGTDSSDELPF